MQYMASIPDVVRVGVEGGCDDLEPCLCTQLLERDFPAPSTQALFTGTSSDMFPNAAADYKVLFRSKVLSV